MEKNQKKAASDKRLISLCAIAFALLYALCVFVIEPLYLGAKADVAYTEATADVLNYAYLIFEAVAIYICYAVVIFVMHRSGERATSRVVLVFVLASFLKYLGKTAVSWYFGGAIPLAWYWDIIDALWWTALELVQLTIVRAFIKKALARTAKKDGELKFTRLYDRENRLVRAAMSAAVTTTVIRLALRIFDDATAILMYGLPKSAATWILMLISYIATLIVGILCYFAIVLALYLFASKYGEDD